MICEAWKIKSKNTINSTYIQIITCKNIQIITCKKRIKNCKSRGWRNNWIGCLCICFWIKDWNCNWWIIFGRFYCMCSCRKCFASAELLKKFTCRDKTGIFRQCLCKLYIKRSNCKILLFCVFRFALVYYKATNLSFYYQCGIKKTIFLLRKCMNTCILLRICLLSFNNRSLFISIQTQL